MDQLALNAVRRAQAALQIVAQPARRQPAFSLVRTLLGLEADRLDGFEREVLAEFGGKDFDPHRPVVPFALLGRDLSLAANGGGYLAETATLPPADLLRPYSVLARAGATIVDVRGGDAVLPTTATRPTITWLASETAELSGTSAVLSAAAFTPKHAASMTIASGLLLRQSPLAEPFIRRNLLEAAGVGLDRGALAGSGGSGEPLGILNSPGIGSQSGADLAQAGVVHMKKLVADAGAQDEAISFIGSTGARELLEKRERALGLGFVWDGNTVASQPAYAVPSTGENAIMPAATLLAGDFSRLTAALWGIEISPDPFTLFASNRVQYRVSLLVDCAVSQADAFCASSSIT